MKTIKSILLISILLMINISIAKAEQIKMKSCDDNFVEISFDAGHEGTATMSIALGNSVINRKRGMVEYKLSYELEKPEASTNNFIDINVKAGRLRKKEKPGEYGVLDEDTSEIKVNIHYCHDTYSYKAVAKGQGEYSQAFDNLIKEIQKSGFYQKYAYN